MNNSYPYRIFQGPILPFVGGMLVGGLVTNNKFNQPTPQPMYPVYYPPYPIQYPTQTNIYTPSYIPPYINQVQYPTSDNIYVLNEPNLYSINQIEDNYHR